MTKWSAGCAGKAPLQRSTPTEDVPLTLSAWLVLWEVWSLWSCQPLHDGTLALRTHVLLQPASPSALVSFALAPFQDACSFPFAGRPLWCHPSELKWVPYSGNKTESNTFFLTFSGIWVLAPSSQNVVQVLLNSLFCRHPNHVSHAFESLFSNDFKHSSCFCASVMKTFFPFPCLLIIFSVASTH